MSQHTKEPWHVGGNGTIIYDEDGWGVASATVFHGRQQPETSEANARRIVAAVNVCKNFTTTELEEVGENFSGVLADTRQRCAELVAQNDELLAAIKNLNGDYKDLLRDQFNYKSCSTTDEIDALIAKIETK